MEHCRFLRSFVVRSLVVFAAFSVLYWATTKKPFPTLPTPRPATAGRAAMALQSRRIGL